MFSTDLAQVGIRPATVAAAIDTCTAACWGNLLREYELGYMEVKSSASNRSLAVAMASRQVPGMSTRWIPNIAVSPLPETSILLSLDRFV